MVSRTRIGSIFLMLQIFMLATSFKTMTHMKKIQKPATGLRMVMDYESLANINNMVDHIPHWAQFAAQGIADADAPIICPGFGEPGWGPFCFLNGNPVFKAFDSYQEFIQQSVVSLHNNLMAAGIKNAYGPSIILFTFLVRLLIFPVTFNQLASTQKTQALNPLIKEIRTKYADDKAMQSQMISLLYEETKVNPLAGCLPALVQIPVFLALYRSFFNLAQTNELDEPFLWLPSLDGPTYGARSTDWLFANWHDLTPSLGWDNTLAFLSIPVLLIIAQTVSLNVLTPPSDDPAVQQSQRILKYLPVLLGYFSLSVPAGLGVYWVTNNILSTVTTGGIRAYFKANPTKVTDIDLEKLANNQNSAYSNPVWGYATRQQIVDEATLNYKLPRKSKIPADFMPIE